MAFDYQLSFTVDENGVSYTDGNTDILANTSAGTFDPSVTGRDAPIGSQFLRTNGTLYLKYGPATTNWRRIAQAPISSTNDVWVSKVGDDTTGDGSFDNPYLTVKKGVQAALAIVAVTPQPVLVKVLAGVYDEVNPIAMSGTNSEYISVQGDQENMTIIRPTVNTDFFTMTSNVVPTGPSLFNMLIDCSSLPAFKTSNRSAVTVTGPGRFVLNAVNIKSAGIGYNTGNGTSTNQEAVYDFATIEDCTVAMSAKGSGIHASQVFFLRNNATGLLATGNVRVEFGNFETQGGVGFDISDNVSLNGTSGAHFSHTTGLIANDSTTTKLFGSVFGGNTIDFNQVDGTATIVITGRLGKQKQLITDGTRVSIQYIDETSRDFIVGNADATGDPGKEFRVRDFDGRVAIGDEATNANIASGGVGGSRTINLIDTNGNMRVWRFVSDAGVDPAVELIKGINPANTDGDGDAPIVSITAGTDTIVIDVSGTDFNDPLATPPGIDRTTLATRAFPAGRVFRVNGTASNNGNYTVSSATYNSGPQTISIVVTTDITVTEGAVGTVVFGGGAGRTDGVSTYVGDPGAAVAAGAGNVWWDTFIQEDDHFVIRRRTGGGGDPDNEKVRVYRDRSEWLGASTYSDSDNALIAVLQHNANAVNYLNLQNSATTSPVVISALGTDTDVSFNMIPKNNGTLNLRSSGAFAPAMRFYDADSSNYTGIKASDTTTANVTYSLPPADGTSGQVLSTNGAGALTWATASGGGGTVTSVSGGTTGLTFTNPTTTPTMTGTLDVDNGGTGLATLPTNGQLLIGNGTGYTLATITAGSGITVTNGAGTITLSSPNGAEIDACRVATTGNLNLAAPGATIDGVTMVAGDRVLVWQQTTTADNGIYTWNGAATPMTRVPDMSTNWDVQVPGRRQHIQEGNTYGGDFEFINDSPAGGTFGVTPLTINSKASYIGPILIGNSATPAIAGTGGFGQRVWTMIDTNAQTRVWRYLSSASGNSSGLEMAIGNNPDLANSANYWWDMSVHSSGEEGCRWARRTGGGIVTKLFVDTQGRMTIGNTTEPGGGAGGPNFASINGVDLYVNNLAGIRISSGTTGDRPITPINATIRYNTTTNKFEVYENGVWRNLTTGGQGSLQLYAENPTGTPAVSATGTNSQAFGDGAVSRLYGAMTDSSGNFAANGDAQNIRVIARATTNNAATTPLFLDGAGATQRMVLQNNSAWTFEILVTARQVGANLAGGYRFQGVIRRDATAASTTFVGTPSKTVLGENVAAWDANVTADTTNGALNINVNGTAGNTIRWVATVNIAEVLT